jgi:SAM-dependent methyltransferase
LAALAGAVALAALPAGGAAQGQDVPFITTPDSITVAMLTLAEVGPTDHVLDLGSGDGRIVITAARRFGARGVGVEIVPDLVLRSRAAATAAGVADRARFVEQDLFATDLSGASVITMYLLPEVNLQLRPRLLALAPGTRIVSHDWDLGDWAPDRTWVLATPEKPIGREKISRVHLWWVPAAASGLWCGLGGQRLDLQQRFQRVEGRWMAPLAGTPPQGGGTAEVREGEQATAVQGWLKGHALALQGTDGRTLSIDLARAGDWRRASDGRCPQGSG